MATSKTGARVHATRQMAPRCSAIAGWMRARRDLLWARHELAQIAELAQSAGAGIVPHSEKDGHPDALANLWFVRAVHEFGAAAHSLGIQEPAQAGFSADTFIPLCKSIVQHFVTDRGVEGVRMDDGGLLTGSGPESRKLLEKAGLLRVNALWYTALEMTSQALLHGTERDPAGGHFERLAGRFRRSFVKTHWFESDKAVAVAGSAGDSGAPVERGDLPPADQVLLAALPASPLPRTKQRQILTRICHHALGKMGVLINHPTQGLVESPLHRAWLALGLAVDDLPHAKSVMGPLKDLWESGKRHGIHAYYRDGLALAPVKPDPLATAEVLGALEQLFHPHHA